MKLIVAASMLITGGSVLAADTPNPMQELKKSRVDSCVSKGIQRGSSPDESKRLCTCVYGVFFQNLTTAEFTQMESLAAGGGNPSTLPFWPRIEAKLKQCRASDSNASKP